MPILNRSYVLAPFEDLLSASQTNVLLGLRLSEKVEIFPGPTAEEIQFLQVMFGGPAADLSQSKARSRWILLNGARRPMHWAVLQGFITLKTIEAERSSARRSTSRYVKVNSAATWAVFTTPNLSREQACFVPNHLCSSKRSSRSTGLEIAWSIQSAPLRSASAIVRRRTS